MALKHVILGIGSNGSWSPDKAFSEWGRDEFASLRSHPAIVAARNWEGKLARLALGPRFVTEDEDPWCGFDPPRDMLPRARRYARIIARRDIPAPAKRSKRSLRRCRQARARMETAILRDFRRRAGW